MVDGQPIRETQVIFQPEGDQGSPSYGFTDSNGQYELSYKRGRNGALVGWHKVSLEMDTEVVGTSGEYVRRRQLIPPRYNKNSELRREVKSNEKNVFDFEINSAEK